MKLFCKDSKNELHFLQDVSDLHSLLKAIEEDCRKKFISIKNLKVFKNEDNTFGFKDDKGDIKYVTK